MKSFSHKQEVKRLEKISFILMEKKPSDRVATLIFEWLPQVVGSIDERINVVVALFVNENKNKKTITTTAIKPRHILLKT